MSDVIQEVKEALQAATPGPWEQDDEPYVLGNGQVVCRLWHFNGEYQNQDNNATLIANSPTWLQQLIDRLETAERQRDEANKAIKETVEGLKDVPEEIENLKKQLEEAVKALEAIAESDDEWYVGRKTMQYYAICTLKRIKGENG